MSTCVIYIVADIAHIIDVFSIRLLLLTLTLLLGFTIEFFTWGTPKWFKKWANRNYKDEDETLGLTEEELIQSMEAS